MFHLVFLYVAIHISGCCIWYLMLQLISLGVAYVFALEVCVFSVCIRLKHFR
ncbi:hypothetical protein DAI22_06g140000 [Oryza sativa Japonica Group]|nr:hypothetical protein DAI22_06g140000 [Oryza sativa Japonica Group]